MSKVLAKAQAALRSNNGLLLLWFPDKMGNATFTTMRGFTWGGLPSVCSLSDSPKGLKQMNSLAFSKMSSMLTHFEQTCLRHQESVSCGAMASRIIWKESEISSLGLLWRSCHLALSPGDFRALLCSPEDFVSIKLRFQPLAQTTAMLNSVVGRALSTLLPVRIY